MTFHDSLPKSLFDDMLIRKPVRRSLKVTTSQTGKGCQPFHTVDNVYSRTFFIYFVIQLLLNFIIFFFLNLFLTYVENIGLSRTAVCRFLCLFVFMIRGESHV